MTDLNFADGTVETAVADLRNDMADVAVCGNSEETLGYWRKQLAGIPAILELPTDRPRPPAQSGRFATHSATLPLALQMDLRKLSEAEGVSEYLLLLTAFNTLLTRYTRQDDIVVGAHVGRGAEALAIRTDFSGELSFRQLLQRVTESARNACRYQDIPWDVLVKAVQPEQDASRHPIFQAAFAMEESGREAESTALNGDLRLQIAMGTDGWAAEFTYSTDLFDAATIARMAGHFAVLLHGIVENPGELIARLPLLTEPERHQLVVEWNSTQMEYPRNLCVHQMFEAQAARIPDATAIVFGSHSLTYAELDERSNQLARHLLELGAQPDGLVGICLERSLEMVVGLLGILKAGCAYVPLDPAYPSDRIAYMLENSEAPLLLTQASLVGNLPKGNSKAVLIDSDWAEIGQQSAIRPELKLNPENRAYVIYTSGSTGKPKGVEIPHRAVVNFLTTMAEKPGLNGDDRLLAITTLSFDIAGLEMYLPLTQGASLEIVSREVAADGKQLLEKLTNSCATVMQATPATWRMLLEAGWTGDRRLKILIGGEAVSQKLAAQLLERAGSVWNVYGPTETTIWSTTSKLEVGQGAVTIGRPIGNTEIFILDKVLQPVPIGVAGELHIGGDGLARGYLKRPELTAEKFIAHPLNPGVEARLYKTGDLVRYLPNGNIEFLGRIDHQVKIRGFRIELGEIETVLRQHPRINDCVVVAREDVPGDKRVVAYLVASGGAAAPTVSELRAFLKEKLPEYMLPSVFVTLERMPLTPNGKVDRRSLPAPSASDLAPQGSFAAPRDAVETQLAKIWESVLNVKPIGIRDNYFELGGHSLVAVRLMNRIVEDFGKNLPIATLLQAPTIEQLANIVRGQGSSEWSCLVPIQAGGSKTPFFCIHGANGAVVRFHTLSKYLGADQPFYGVQAYGLEAGQEPAMRTEEMAARYIEEIRKVQPEGPYVFGGYSFGGAIAYEMARELAAQGQPDSMVVLFDTNFPGPNGSGTQSTLFALRSFFRVPLAQKPAYLWRMMTAPLRAIERRLHVAKLPDYVKKVRSACFQAERDYTPQPYGGRVIMFRSNHKPLGQVTDPRAGWATCATRGLETYEVHGNHENILLEPQVRTVAEQLQACLNEAKS